MAWTGLKEAEANKQAQAQHGVLSWDQLKKLGCSRRTVRRRVKSGHWLPLYPRVYRLCHSAHSANHQYLMAACLWAGKNAFVSGGAAARLHGLDGMDDEYPIEISVNGKHRGKGPEGVFVHRVDVVPHDSITRIDGIPCARIERTLLELAHQWPEEEAEAALDCAIRLKKTTRKGLTLYLDKVRGRGLRGLRSLEALIDAHSGIAKDSVAELKFLRSVVRPLGLEDPTHNYGLPHASGKPKYFIDYVFETLGVGIELHSKKFHLSAVQRRRDTEKANAALLAGLSLLVFWRDDLYSDPEGVAQTLREALIQAAERMASDG